MSNATADDEDEILPDGWPPPGLETSMANEDNCPNCDGEPLEPDPTPPPVRTNRAAPKPVVPLGFFEVHDREHLGARFVRLSEVVVVMDSVNPKDGPRITIRSVGFIEVNESYAQVMAAMNAAYQRLEDKDRGFPS